MSAVNAYWRQVNFVLALPRALTEPKKINKSNSIYLLIYFFIVNTAISLVLNTAYETVIYQMRELHNFLWLRTNSRRYKQILSWVWSHNRLRMTYGSFKSTAITKQEFHSPFYGLKGRITWREKEVKESGRVGNRWNTREEAEKGGWGSRWTCHRWLPLPWAPENQGQQKLYVQNTRPRMS